MVLVNGKKGTEHVHNLHNCSVLCETSPCRPCTLAAKDLARKQKVEDKQRFKHLATKAPLTKVAKNRLVLAIRTHRDKEKKLEEKIETLEGEIASKGIDLETEVHKDLRQILESGIKNSLIILFNICFGRSRKRLSSKQYAKIFQIQDTGKKGFFGTMMR